jgi:hypothetical protein
LDTAFSQFSPSARCSVPIQALTPSRRDLTVSGFPQVVQTTVGDEVIPFLRAKTVCGRLGAQLIDDLVSGNLGNLKLPRATGGGVASWLPETGLGSDADQRFDYISLIPKRITASTVLSRQLILQSSPDIEAYVANDLATRSVSRSTTLRSTVPGQHRNRSAFCIIRSMDQVPTRTRRGQLT